MKVFFQYLPLNLFTSSIILTYCIVLLEIAVCAELHVCVLHVCVSVYTYVGVFVRIIGQHQVSSLVDWSPYYVLGQRVSRYLEFTNFARTAVHKAPGITSTELGSQSCMIMSCSLCGCWWSALKSSCLHSKHLIHWNVTLAPEISPVISVDPLHTCVRGADFYLFWTDLKSWSSSPSCDVENRLFCGSTKATPTKWTLSLLDKQSQLWNS